MLSSPKALLCCRKAARVTVSFLGRKTSCKPHNPSSPSRGGKTQHHVRITVFQRSKMTFRFKPCCHTRGCSLPCLPGAVRAKKQKYLCSASEFKLIFSKAPSLWSSTSFSFICCFPRFDPKASSSSSIFSLTQQTFIPMTCWLWGQKRNPRS